MKKPFIYYAILLSVFSLSLVNAKSKVSIYFESNSNNYHRNYDHGYRSGYNHQGYQGNYCNQAGPSRGYYTYQNVLIGYNCYGRPVYERRRVYVEPAYQYQYQSAPRVRSGGYYTNYYE